MGMINRSGRKLNCTLSPHTVFQHAAITYYLNGAKLSSDHHRVKVFFYRGATAGGILKRLKEDPIFLSLNPSNIKQVFMLCGTNDVDTILNIQKPMYSNVDIKSRCARNYSTWENLKSRYPKTAPMYLLE